MPHILESAGITEVYSALLGNGVGGAVNFVATLFVLLYVRLIIAEYILPNVQQRYTYRLTNGIDDAF